jgi:dihydrofolate reductase
VGQLVVTEFITLDGVFEDPGGAEGFQDGGWAFKFDRGQEGDRFKLDELLAADVQLLGRRTYEGFAAAWPKMANTGPFGEKMNAMPKIVASTTLQTADWNNSTIIRDDVAGEVSALKDTHSGDILLAGSGQLARSLMDAGLVDEVRLMVFPVVLGRGKRLFDGAQRAEFRTRRVIRTGECTTVLLVPR